MTLQSFIDERERCRTAEIGNMYNAKARSYNSCMGSAMNGFENLESESSAA